MGPSEEMPGMVTTSCVGPDVICWGGLQGAAALQGGADVRLGAGAVGWARAPQRGGHGRGPAGRGARRLRGGPPARPEHHRLPGQVHPEEAQGSAPRVRKPPFPGDCASAQECRAHPCMAFVRQGALGSLHSQDIVCLLGCAGGGAVGAHLMSEAFKDRQSAPCCRLRQRVPP